MPRTAAAHSDGTSASRHCGSERQIRRGARCVGEKPTGERTEVNMAQVSYDEVNLMLRLYDMRREPRLRQARAWFVENFHPTSAEDMMEKYPQGSEENTYIRMVISYWDMVASIVNRGLINDELFFESNGE